MKLTLELRADGSGLTGTVRVAAAELQRLNATADRTSAAGRAAGRGIDDIDRASKTAAGSVRRLATHVNTLRGTLTTLGVAYVAREFLSAGLAMTRFDNGLSAALGSQQLARQEMAFLRGEAERLGIYLPVMVQGFTGLASATRGTALEGEKTRLIFSGVAEAGRAMNLTNDQIAGTLNALQQIAGKGTVSMEELRLQLGDRLPGAMQIAARSMGMTVAELTKMVSEGKVLSEDFLPKFAAELSRSAAAGVEFSRNSPAAQFERLKTALFELAAVGSAAPLAALADGAKDLAGGIQSLVDGGYVETLVQTLGLLSQAALLAFGGRTLQSVGAYTAAQMKAIAATSAMLEMEQLAAAQAVKTAEANLAAARTDVVRAEAEMQVAKATLASTEAVTVAALKTYDLAAANVVASQRHYDAAKSAGAQSFALRELRIATENLSEARRRRDAADLAHLQAGTQVLKQERALAQSHAAMVGLNGQVAVATDALSAAQARAGAATTLLATAQARLVSAGKAAFAFIGGWPTVALAAAYGIYQMGDALVNGSDEAQEAAGSLAQMSDSMDAAFQRSQLLAAGIEEDSVQMVASLQNVITAMRDMETAQIDSAAQLGSLGNVGLFKGPAMLVDMYRELERDASLKKLNAELDRYLERLGRSIAMSEDLPAAIDSATASLRAAGMQTDGLAESLNWLSDRVSNVTSVYQWMQKVMSDGAAAADFNGPSNALSAQTAALTDEENKLIDSIEERTRVMGLSRVATLELAKADAVAEASSESAAKQIAAAYDAEIRKTLAVESATEAERNQEKALRAQEQAMQKHVASLDAALAGYDDWQRGMEDLAAELAGPMAQAQLDYDRALIEAESNAVKFGLTTEELRQQKELLRKEFERTTGAIAAEQDVLGSLEDDYENQIRLARLSESERRIEIASLQAITEWRRTHGGAIDAETEARIRQTVRMGESELDMIDAARTHAEEYERAWGDAINNVGDAFGEWIADGMDDFDSFGDALVDTAKKLVAQLIAEFAKVQIARMFAGSSGSLGAAAQSFLGGSSGGGSSFGGLSSLGVGGSMNTFLTSWMRGRGFETASSFVGPPEALSNGASGTASGMQIGAQALGGAVMGVGLGRAIGGVRGGNAGAALGALGSLAGPVGSIIGSVVGGIIGRLTSKPDDLRLGASGQSRKPETSFQTAFGTMDLGTRGPLGGYHAEIISAVQDFDDLIAGVVGGFDQSGDQLQAIKDKLSTWAVDLKGDSATVEEALGQRLSAILTTFSADVQQFVGSAGTLEERTQRLADALSIEAAVDAGTLGDTFASVAALLTDMQAEGEQLTDTYARVVASVQILRDATELMGVQLDLGTEQFARFAAEITEAAGGLERAQALWANYFDRFYSDNELLAMQSSGANAAAQSEFSDIGLSAADFTGEGGVAAFRALFEEQLPTLSAEAVVEWLEAAAALGVVLDLQDQQNAVLQAQAEALADYNSQVAGLRDELDAASMSDFALEMRDIRRWTQETTDSLNTAARAAGLQAANEEDLGLVHQIAAQRAAAAIERLRSSAADLVAELYGSPLDQINEQIAAMEAAQTGSIASVGEAAQDMYAQQLAALQNIQAWLNSQLLGDLSTLTPREQVAEAQRQFEATLALARGGDVDALQRITSEADTLLRLGRDYYASSQPYSDLEALVRGGMQGLVNAGPTGAQLGGQNNVGGGGGVSPELQALYAERDAAMAASELAQRQALLAELGGMIRELIQATGQPLADVASSIGLNLSALAEDLGINLNALSVSTATGLVDMARALGVDVAELATNVGVSLGELGDRQSLLNQALDATLVDIPEEFRNQLTAPLEAIRNATTEADATAAVQAAETAINSMPHGIRDLLAPYFEGVFPAEAVTELTQLSSLAKTSVDQLGVLQNIAAILSAQATAQGVSVPSFAVGTAYVPRDMLANIHQGETILPAPVSDFARRSGLQIGPGGGDSRALLAELRRLREAQSAQARSMETRLLALEAAQKDGAEKIASATRKQTDAITMRGR